MKWHWLFVLLLCDAAASDALAGGTDARVQVASERHTPPTSCPYASALADGCSGAQAHGVIPNPRLADFQRVIMVNVVGGSGYTDGTGYEWTTTGGGCTIAATGTIDVVGGGLTSGRVINDGAGCTSRPYIAVPTAAGSGRHGRIVPTVYQLTPHNTPVTYNLPGVDYPVGYDTTLTLKDPTISGNLPACASHASNNITIYANNCTLNGFDFTLHENNIIVAANVTEAAITNNKFVGNANALENIHVNSGVCGDLTIRYNQFDGRAVDADGSGHHLNAAVLSTCYSGHITYEFNYCFNVDAKCLFIGGGTSAFNTLQVTEQYNHYSQIGICTAGCAHGEAEFSYSGYTSGIVYETINPWIMKFNVAWTYFRPTGATAEMAIEAVAINIANADVEYNYILTPGPMGATGSHNPGPVAMSASMYCGYQQNGSNTGGVMLHNLIDYTGAYFPYNGSGGTCPSSFPAMSDLNAVTGRTCNFKICN